MNATGIRDTGIRDTGADSADRTGQHTMNAQEAAVDRRQGAARAPGTPMAQALEVNRMNIRQWMLFAMPWGIIIVVAGAHAAILGIVRAQGVDIPDEGFNGVGSTLFFFAVAMFASMTTQHFPFALGLGTTRRDVYAGTALTALATGVVNGVLVLVFAQIERATDGLGVHLEVISVVFRLTENRVLLFFGVVLVTMAFAALGMFAGVVYLKWRANGIFTGALVIAIAAAVAALLITWQQGWPAVGRFFTDTPVAALVLGIPAVLGALLFGAGYRMMRTVEV